MKDNNSNNLKRKDKKIDLMLALLYSESFGQIW